MKKYQENQGSLFFPNGSVSFSCKTWDPLKGESDSPYNEKCFTSPFRKQDVTEISESGVKLLTINTCSEKFVLKRNL